MRSMGMEEQCSARINRDVLVSSLHFGCRGCILADGWAALDFALHRGDQRESDCGSEHRRSRERSQNRRTQGLECSRDPPDRCGTTDERTGDVRSIILTLLTGVTYPDKHCGNISACIACGRIYFTGR